MTSKTTTIFMEEENMKKLIALMLSILMVCSLAACASKQDSASRD